MYNPRTGERVRLNKTDPATAWAKVGDAGVVQTWGGTYHGRLVVNIRFDRDNITYSVLVDQLVKERPDTPFERDFRSYIDSELSGPS
jgi:hypothetical protein